jgi:hypothetical protein
MMPTWARGRTPLTSKFLSRLHRSVNDLCADYRHLNGVDCVPCDMLIEDVAKSVLRKWADIRLD